MQAVRGAVAPCSRAPLLGRRYQKDGYGSNPGFASVAHLQTTRLLLVSFRDSCLPANDTHRQRAIQATDEDRNQLSNFLETHPGARNDEASALRA